MSSAALKPPAYLVRNHGFKKACVIYAWRRLWPTVKDTHLRTRVHRGEVLASKRRTRQAFTNLALIQEHREAKANGTLTHHAPARHPWLEHRRRLR